MALRLRDYVNEIDRTDPEESKRAEAIQAAMDKAHLITGERVDHAEIGSVAEMGRAAGTCHLGTGKIQVREDILQGNADMAAHVLVHEAYHKATGSANEGYVEWLTTQALAGEDPVPDYANKVAVMARIATEVGGATTRELAQQEGGEVLVFNRFVAGRVKRKLGGALGIEEATQQAVDEANQLFEQAA